MSMAFEHYINCFLSPKVCQQFLGGEDEGDVLYLPGQRNKFSLKLEECLGVSWLLAIFQAFYAVIIIALGIEFFAVSEDLLANFSQKSLSLKVFFIVLEAAFFPVGFWFYTKFWSKVIHLSCQIFSKKAEEEQCQDLVVKSMTGHCFLLFPFFGKLFSSFAVIIYLFIGLRVKLKLSLPQAMCVLVLPIALVLLSFAFTLFVLVLTVAAI